MSTENNDFELNGKKLDLNDADDRAMFFYELTHLLTQEEKDALGKYQAAEEARKRELYG